jgi:transcriptional regulator with XRE-family HTH domain
MDIAERFGIRVQYLRNQKGMSQAQVCAASAAGLTQPYLSQIEKGRVWVRLDTIEAICRGLGIHPEELFKEIRLDTP